MDVYEFLKLDVVHHQQLNANLTRDLGSFECLRVCKINALNSPVESPLCWGSHVLARLARPKDEATS